MRLVVGVRRLMAGGRAVRESLAGDGFEKHFKDDVNVSKEILC